MTEPIFTYADASLGQDEIEAVYRNEGLTITIDCPWQGDTETGFGATCSIRLQPETARAFAAWIMEQVT